MRSPWVGHSRAGGDSSLPERAPLWPSTAWKVPFLAERSPGGESGQRDPDADGSGLAAADSAAPQGDPAPYAVLLPEQVLDPDRAGGVQNGGLPSHLVAGQLAAHIARADEHGSVPTYALDLAR